jgi:CubicO group peptidase (beta-lactamase class C family)
LARARPPHKVGAKEGVAMSFCISVASRGPVGGGMVGAAFAACLLFLLPNPALAQDAPLTAAAEKEEGPDWPNKQIVRPRSPGETPRPGEELSLTYKCGDETCDLAKFMERQHVCALFVLSEGKPVLHRTSVREDDEEEDDCKSRVENERYRIASITKSITSLLFGMVYRDPAKGTPVDLDAPAFELLAAAGVRYPDRSVTIRNILQMSSGMRWKEEEVGTVIEIRQEADGTPIGDYATLKDSVNARLRGAKFGSRVFGYSGFDSQLLGIMVEQRLATIPRFQRATLDEALERFFWHTLPVNRNAEWNADYDRHPAAHCCSYMAAGDLAALGQWVLEHGQWLPEEYDVQSMKEREWIRASVEDTVDAQWSCRFADTDLSFRYGYQWWIPSGEKNGFTGIGIQGQYLHVFPEQDVVVVQLGERTATNDDTCEAMLVHRLIADTVSKN